MNSGVFDRLGSVLKSPRGARPEEKTKIMIRRLLVSVLVLAFVTIAAAPSARAAGGYLGDNSHVQLKAIMTPLPPKPGSFLSEMRPITPVMTVPKADDVAYVCQRAPRTSEAILLYFQHNPPPLLPNRKVDVDAINKKHAEIAAYVNRALGKNMVSEVYVVEGAGEKMATGAMARLPFAQIQGCSRVLEEYEQRMKAIVGEDGKKKE